MAQALIVFSHLRWNFVYQRPQHLLTRLAAERRVIFLEEPDGSTHPRAYLQRSSPEPNVLVCKPCTPSAQPGYHAEQLPHLTELVQQLLQDLRLKEYIGWFYTPMALPLAEKLSPQGVVYDCMDELSAFLNAPREVKQREAELLKVADIVFTGGPSLYRAKKDRHPNVYCFPSSVDRDHFSNCQGEDDPPEQREIPHPRLGYFGVIDERIDLSLLDHLAQVHPEWHLVMVGPVVKIDSSLLPRRSNIHYLGQQQYVDLPRYVAGWDLCLLPFAMNEATRFISPTKTLEYMAAGKQIVGTPITDIAEPYGEIVFLGTTPEEFVACCEKAMSQSGAERKRREAAMHEVLSRTSWDATVDAMNSILIQTFGKSSAATRRRQTEPVIGV